MKNVKIKAFLLLAMAAVILIGTISGTVAWITTQTPEVKNTFEPTEVKITVTEEFGGVTKKNIKVRNDSDFAVYVRVAVTANWVNDGKIVEAYDLTGLTLQSGWELDGGYYYYTSKVEAGASTGVLFSEIAPEARADGAHLVVDVLAQAIQAEPASARTEAWGYPAASAE